MSLISLNIIFNSHDIDIDRRKCEYKWIELLTQLNMQVFFLLINCCL